jgi:hypothetical protein
MVFQQHLRNLNSILQIKRRLDILRPKLRESNGQADERCQYDVNPNRPHQAILPLGNQLVYVSKYFLIPDR